MFTSTSRYVSALLLAALAATTVGAESPWPAGDWRGMLDVGGQQLEIIYHLETDGDAMDGSMDVPAHGAMGLPLRAVSVDGKRLVIEMSLGGEARFEGSQSGDTVKGTFAQAGESFPLTLTRAEDVQPPARPQEPVTRPTALRPPASRSVGDASETSQEDSVSSTATGTSSGPADDEMLADLNRLVSTDDEIRKRALLELANEFYAGPPRAEGKYSTYGDRLLPVLNTVIQNLNDPYAHHAIEAVYYMSAIHHFRTTDIPNNLGDAGKQQLARLAHYPVPTSYGPLTESLTNVLLNSPNSDARYAAAMTLANGFEPVRDIETLYANQLSLAEGDPTMEAELIGGLSAIGDRVGLSPNSEQVILASLESPNLKTQELAARVIMLHKIAGGVDALVANLEFAHDERNLAVMLRAIVTADGVEEQHIVALEKVASETSQVDRREMILTAIDALRSSGSR